MIRTTAGFKQRVVFGLLSATLITAACSDDDDAVFHGNAGQSGSTGVAGKSNGGNSSAGSTAGGKAGGGDTSTAGKAGAANNAGSAGKAGSSTSGGEGGGAGVGIGGQANGGEGGASEAGGGGEGGAALGGAGGAGGEGPGFVADVLDNPGFETGTQDSSTFPGWTNEGAAFIAFSAPHTGGGRLGHWSAWVDAQTPPYTARTYQTLDPIANGTYSFSLWVDRGWADSQYLFAKGCNAANPDEEVKQVTDAADDTTGYVKITLSGIVVTSGRCTVGVYSAASAGSYSNFDDAEFTLE